jgi:hypothetical protein
MNDCGSVFVVFKLLVFHHVCIYFCQVMHPDLHIINIVTEMDSKVLLR